MTTARSTIAAASALRLRTALALLCTGLLGCSQDAAEETLPTTPAAASAAASQPPITPTAATSENASESPSDSSPAENSAAENYAPPFPDRVELFVAPKRRGPSTRKRGVHDEAVELLGFITVDRPRVVLSIDGQVAPVAQGDMKFGIEVISIEPPKVVLQRGRQRWQASLEN